MENKSPAELKTIQLFYDAINDPQDERTIGEHITQLLIDLYDTHLVVCWCWWVHSKEYENWDREFECGCCGWTVDQDDSDLFY
jgi:hypothetical protein